MEGTSQPLFPPLNIPEHVFTIPEKRINTQEDFETWKRSTTFKCYLGFVRTLNDAVKGKKVSDECHVSPVRLSPLGFTFSDNSKLYQNVGQDKRLD